MPLATISSRPSTSTVTAPAPAAISSARAARKAGVAKLAGVLCRSRARFWASAQIRAVSAAAVDLAPAPAASATRAAACGSSGSPLRKRSKR